MLEGKRGECLFHPNIFLQLRVKLTFEKLTKCKHDCMASAQRIRERKLWFVLMFLGYGTWESVRFVLDSFGNEKDVEAFVKSYFGLEEE